MSLFQTPTFNGKWLPLLAALLCSCGQYAPPDTLDRGPRWSLEDPFYIFVSPTMPKADLVRAGMREALGRAGGKVTVDERARQVLNLLDTDGGECVKQGVTAFANLPASGKIYYCHSVTLLASYTSADFTRLAGHELGHVLANRPWHIGGDPPVGTCTSHAVMASNLTCQPAELSFSAEDREYICAGRNVIGGLCTPRQLP